MHCPKSRLQCRSHAAAFPAVTVPSIASRASLSNSMNRHSSLLTPSGATASSLTSPASARRLLIRAFSALLASSDGLRKAHLEAFPQQTGLLTVVYGMTYGAGQLMSPLMALLVRSQGERRVAVGSSLCMFAGYSLSYFAADARLLLPTFGLMVPLAAEGLYFFPMTLLAYNFNRRLALASGVVTSGCGIGLLLSAPVTQMLISAFTWRGAALLLGAVSLNAGALALLIRPRPALSLELPLDEAAPAADDDKVVKQLTSTDAGRLAKIADMLRSCGPDIGLLHCAALLQSFCGVVTINFAPVMASELSVPVDRIAVLPAGFGVAFTLGNLVFGYMGTRLEPFLVDSANLIISSVLTGALPSALRYSEALGLAVYCGMGACQGGRYALTGSVIKEAFGLQHYEICTGFYFTTFFFGSFPAPFLGQWLRRRNGDYSAVFYLASGAFSVAGLAKLASWALQPRRQWRRRGHSAEKRQQQELEQEDAASPFVPKDSNCS